MKFVFYKPVADMSEIGIQFGEKFVGIVRG